MTRIEHEARRRILRRVREGMAAERAGEFVVLWRGFPVRFEEIEGKQVYSLVEMDEATRFGSEVEAESKWWDYGMEIYHVQVRKVASGRDLKAECNSALR